MYADMAKVIVNVLWILKTMLVAHILSLLLHYGNFNIID